MPIVLNLGAGAVQPLPKYGLLNIEELADCEIINLDIYNQIVPYSPDRSNIPFPHCDIRYSDAEKRINLPDGSIDFIIAVSPYNYAVINPETLRVLKMGGIALVMGSQRNKYVTKIEHMCSSDIHPHFMDLFEILPPNDLAWKCINFLAQRGSYVTSGTKPTKIDFFGIYRRG